MLKIDNAEVFGLEHATRGMRNPMNSWHLSDSESSTDTTPFKLGEADHGLLMKLAKGGPVHGKYRRMINVYLDITAPLYWWKEFDTYKIGTVANSCSTMHKIHDKEFVLDDFSHEHLISDHPVPTKIFSPLDALSIQISILNVYRDMFIQTKDKKYWWQMIQLLPTSYNQRRTVMLNYEVLANIYSTRKNHKLDEWHTFCDWIEELPCFDLIEVKQEYI